MTAYNAGPPQVLHQNQLHSKWKIKEAIANFAAYKCVSKANREWLDFVWHDRTSSWSTMVWMVSRNVSTSSSWQRFAINMIASNLIFWPSGSAGSSNDLAFASSTNSSKSRSTYKQTWTHTGNPLSGTASSCQFHATAKLKWRFCLSPGFWQAWTSSAACPYEQLLEKLHRGKLPA